MLILSLLACTGTSSEPAAEPAPEAPPAETPEIPRFTPPSKTEAPPPPPDATGGVKVRAEAMRRQCEQDCSRAIAFIADESKPPPSRIVMWWALSEAEVSGEDRAKIEEIAVAGIPNANPGMWRSMTANLRHTESGQAALSELVKTGADPILRASAACALRAAQPDTWTAEGLDEETVAQMRDCPTPWTQDG